MLGKKFGVATQIKELQPKVYYTHCHGHTISLSVKEVTKQSNILGNTMGVAEEIVVLIKYSPKRENILGSIKEQVEFESEPEEKANDITKLSQTRWTVRATCLQRVIDNYEALMKVWIHCLDNGKMESELKGRIIGVKTQMESFELYFGLHLGARLYSHTDNLARSVQNKGMSACSSKRLANLTIQTLETLRNEERYENFYETVLKTAKLHQFVNPPTLKRKRRAPNYSILQFIEGSYQSEEAHHPSSPKENYRTIYYEALDCLINSLKERFTQPSFVAYDMLESFLLKSLDGEDIENERKYIDTMYNEELNYHSLTNEIDTLKVILNGNIVECFDDILKCVKGQQHQLMMMPNIVNLLKLLLVNPATSATAERSFSLARRLKTWMRSTMLPGRLNAIAILHEHKTLTDRLNLTDIAKEFVCRNESRKCAFGNFY